MGVAALTGVRLRTGHGVGADTRESLGGTGTGMSTTLLPSDYRDATRDARLGWVTPIFFHSLFAARDSWRSESATRLSELRSKSSTAATLAVAIHVSAG